MSYPLPKHMRPVTGNGIVEEQPGNNNQQQTKRNPFTSRKSITPSRDRGFSGSPVRTVIRPFVKSSGGGNQKSAGTRSAAGAASSNQQAAAPFNHNAARASNVVYSQPSHATARHKKSMELVHKELKDVYSIYLPRSVDVKKDIAKHEATKLLNTTYGSHLHNGTKHRKSSDKSFARKKSSPMNKDNHDKTASNLVTNSRKLVEQLFPVDKDRSAELVKLRAEGKSKMDAILKQQRMKELADAQRIADLRRMSSLVVRRSSHSFDNHQVILKSSVNKSDSRNYYSSSPSKKTSDAAKNSLTKDSLKNKQSSNHTEPAVSTHSLQKTSSCKSAAGLVHSVVEKTMCITVVTPATPPYSKLSILPQEKVGVSSVTNEAPQQTVKHHLMEVVPGVQQSNKQEQTNSLTRTGSQEVNEKLCKQQKRRSENDTEKDCSQYSTGQGESVVPDLSADSPSNQLLQKSTEQSAVPSSYEVEEEHSTDKAESEGSISGSHSLSNSYSPQKEEKGTDETAGCVYKTRHADDQRQVEQESTQLIILPLIDELLDHVALDKQGVDNLSHHSADEAENLTTSIPLKPDKIAEHVMAASCCVAVDDSFNVRRPLFSYPVQNDTAVTVIAEDNYLKCAISKADDAFSFSLPSEISINNSNNSFTQSLYKSATGSLTEQKAARGDKPNCAKEADLMTVQHGFIHQDHCYTVLPALYSLHSNITAAVELERKPGSVDIQQSVTAIGMCAQPFNDVTLTVPASQLENEAGSSGTLQRIQRVLSVKRKPFLKKPQTLSLTTKQMLLDVYGSSYTEVKVSSSISRKPSYDRYVNRRHGLNINKRKETADEILKNTLNTLNNTREEKSKRISELLKHKSLLENRNHNRCIERVRAAQKYADASAYFEEIFDLRGPCSTLATVDVLSGSDSFSGGRCLTLLATSDLATPRQNSEKQVGDLEESSSSEMSERKRDKSQDKETVLKVTDSQALDDTQESHVNQSEQVNPHNSARSPNSRSETDDVLAVIDSDVWNSDGMTSPLVKKTESNRKHHHQKTSHLSQRQRSVKFSHSTVAGGAEKEVINLNEFNEEEDLQHDDVLNVTNVRSPSGSAANSRRASIDPVHQANRERRFSIEAPNDPLGFGMSSFLTTRDSLEVAMKKNSKNQSKIDSDELLKNHLSKLIKEINAGKLGTHEMVLLNNFAQKLISAHSAGEVIGSCKTKSDVELITDVPSHDAQFGSSKSPSIKTDISRNVTDTVNILISDIKSNRLNSVQLADLALSLVEYTSTSVSDMRAKLESITSDECNKRSREAVLNSMQSSLKKLRSGSIGADATEVNTTRIKWHEETESQLVIRVLHKLKTQMVLAPSGGTFVESIEKVIKDIDEDIAANYLYDSMIIVMCLVVTYQKWQSSQGEEGIFWKRKSNDKSPFDSLASELTVEMFNKVTAGVAQHKYDMEDLIRLTTLVASCDLITPHAGQLSLQASGGQLPQTKPMKEHEEMVVEALKLMKELIHRNKATLQDVNVLTQAAYKLQSKTTGGAVKSSHSIWSIKQSSSRLLFDWTSSTVEAKEAANADVEIGFVTHLRVKINSLKESYGHIELLAATLLMTESALNSLAQFPHLTDFWAASLVLVVALVFEKIKSECYTAALDYKVLDLLVNNLVFEAFNVALKRLEAKEIDLATFQILTTTVTKYRSIEHSQPVFGVLPTALTGFNKGPAVQAVASPYAVMDFLERSLQIMKSPAVSNPVEIKLLGDYALSLQHYYGQEIVAQEVPTSLSPVASEAPKMSSRKWSGVSNAETPAQSQPVTPEVILTQLDKAIDKVRQQDTTADDLLAIASFITYLIEIPEKLAKDESPSLPDHVCTLKEYELRLVKIRKITHYIPRFDFIMKNLDKTLSDLKNDAVSSFNYDLILLSMCIFIAYEWIRTEPLSVFSVTKLDDRAANVIYEAMQSTLSGIKNGKLAMQDLQNLTSIITNTTDLRRASTVNVSPKRVSQRHDSTAIPGPPPRILVNDAMVLEFIDELVLNDAVPTSLNVEKLNKVLTAMQNGSVSSYLYELLVLSICVAASRKALLLSNEQIAAEEDAKSRPKPDKEMQEFAVKAIKRTIDGLRSGCVHEDEVRELTQFVVKQTNESILKPQELNTAATRLTTRGAELAGLLMGMTSGSSDNLSGASNALAVGKILDFFVNLGNMASELGSSLSDLSMCRHSVVDEGKTVKIVDGEDRNQKSTMTIRSPSRASKASNKTHLLQELVKEAVNRLLVHVNNDYFTNEQLRSIADILETLTNYHEEYYDEDDKGRVQRMLNSVLLATKQLVTTPEYAEHILNGYDKFNLSLLTSPGAADTKAKTGSPDPKARTDLRSALNIVLDGLERNQFTREEIDRLSHALGEAFHNLEPEPESVKDIELHAMMGKRPLHVSSDFLGEALSAISVRPDGTRRYSYRSLINPDISKVEGIQGTPEKAMPRRLSLMSDHNVAHSAMSPIDEEERGRRRASLPTKDLALGLALPGLDDDEEEEDWEASCKVVNIVDSTQAIPGASPEKKSDKNNNSCVDMKSSEEAVDINVANSLLAIHKIDETDQQIDEQQISADATNQRNNNASTEDEITNCHSTAPKGFASHSEQAYGDANAKQRHNSQTVAQLAHLYVKAMVRKSGGKARNHHAKNNNIETKQMLGKEKPNK